jgi:hypothetical protein
MATQKVRAYPGALERQHRNQGQRSTRRKAAVYGLAAPFVLVAAVIVVGAPPATTGTLPGEPSARSVSSIGELRVWN